MFKWIWNDCACRLGSRANDSMAGGVAALLQPLAVSARLHCLTLHVPGKLQPRDIMAIVSLTVCEYI